MPAPRPITLPPSDHERLCLFLPRGKANARTFTRAQVLLKLSENWTGAEIADVCGVSQNTVSNVRTRFLRGGLEAALSDKRREPGAHRAAASAPDRDRARRDAWGPPPLELTHTGGQSRRVWRCRAHSL